MYKTFKKNYFLLLSSIVLLEKCSYTQKNHTHWELSYISGAFFPCQCVIFALNPVLDWWSGTPFDLIIFQDHTYIKVKILYPVNSHFYWALLLTGPVWHIIPPQRVEGSGMWKETLAREGTCRCPWSGSPDVGSVVEASTNVLRPKL